MSSPDFFAPPPKEEDHGRHRQADPQISLDPSNGACSAGNGTSGNADLAALHAARANFAAINARQNAGNGLAQLVGHAQQQAASHGQYLGGLMQQNALGQLGLGFNTPQFWGYGGGFLAGNVAAPGWHPDDLKDDGLVIGEVYAFKSIGISDVGKFYSPIQGTEWAGRLLKSKGTIHDHNDAGIFAFKESTDAQLYTGHFYARVKCWGEIVEHENGYRVQYCKVVQLFASGRLRSRLGFPTFEGAKFFLACKRCGFNSNGEAK